MDTLIHFNAVRLGNNVSETEMSKTVSLVTHIVLCKIWV